MKGRRLKGLLTALALGGVGSLSAESLPAYTNHAGMAVVGVPVALTARETTLSNACETERLPLSIFPENERRRLVADYVARHPEAGTQRLLVPPDIRQVVDAGDKAIRRSRLRAEKDLCSREQSDDFCQRTQAVLRQYLDRQEKEGRLLPVERRLLSPR